MSSAVESEYGSTGKIGIGTPQANPTVEAEIGILLPRTCTLHITRLTSGASQPQERLKEYLRDLERYLGAFDTLRPEVFGFACTGSSYLLGAREEERLIGSAQSAHGYPVETAARAIVWSLARMRARRIAVAAPYPDDLIAAAHRYWAEAGMEIVRTVRIVTRTADTRSIYELGSEQLAAALEDLSQEGVDAVLVSGTGLRSLPVIRQRADCPPTISSNLCLAGRLLDLAGRSELLEPGSPFIRGWQHRLDEALAPSL
jgi:maleate isomerase